MPFLGYLTALTSLGAFILSAPAFNNAYVASTNFLEYEDTAKKAAQYSQTADDQLWKTRYTMGAGAIASVVSLASAAFMTLNGILGGAGTIGLGVAVVNVFTVMGVNSYIRNFWGGSARIPMKGARQYNDGVRATERLMGNLGRMAIGWAVVAVVCLITALTDTRGKLNDTKVSFGLGSVVGDVVK